MVLRTADGGYPLVITHGLGEWVDVNACTGAQRRVHQQVNVHRRRLLVAAIELCGQVHGSLMWQTGTGDGDGEGRQGAWRASERQPRLEVPSIPTGNV